MKSIFYFGTCMIILCVGHVFSSQKPQVKHDNIIEWLEELNASDPEDRGIAAQQILKHADEINISIVRAAISVAGEIGDFRTNPFLIKILLNEFDDEKSVFFDSSTRALSGLALGDIMGYRGFQPENAEEGKGEEKQDFVSKNIVEALLKTIDPTEISDVRLASAQALRNSCDKDAYEALKAIAQDENEDAFLRAISIRSLTNVSTCLQRKGGFVPNPSDYPLYDSLYTEELKAKLKAQLGELLNRVKLQ